MSLMFASALILSRFTTSMRMTLRVCGEGVLKESGRYPAGTANNVGVAALETPLVDGARLDDRSGIGVGVRLSPGSRPKLSIS